MSRAASGQHPLPLDFYHTFVLHLPCFHHTSTAFLPYFFHASTMLQPYFYHASTGVYLLGNQWCSPWSLVGDLTSSGFFSSPIGVPVPLFFQCRRGDQHMKRRIEKQMIWPLPSSPCPLSYVVLLCNLPSLLPKQITSVA